MASNASLLEQFSRARQAFQKDLNALPAEAFSQNFGGKSRSAADIVWEVIAANDWMTAKLQGLDSGAPPNSEGWMRAPEDKQDKETLIGELGASLDRMEAAMASATEDQLAEPSGSQEGAWPKGEFCRLAGVHLWYHSGQINYIQTILGDEEWHWK